MSQLPLALKLDRHARFESFVVAGNHALVAHLHAVADGVRREILWVAGERGSGKSHLLQATCARAGEAGRRAMYLDLAQAPGPEALRGLEAIEVLTLDGVGTVASVAAWEQALFTVLNAAYAGAPALVLAANQAPAAVHFSLADLASRAAGAVVYRLQPLDDDGRLRALVRHASIRGLELDDATAAYLFRRVRREMPALVDWLDRIDRESLVAQRRITIPFVRELLESSAGEP